MIQCVHNKYDILVTWTQWETWSDDDLLMLQVRKYGELYAQTRLETLDCLDKLSDLDTHDDLKSKLLFSVIVVSIFFCIFVF